MFNESQQSYLVTRLRHVEELLSEGIQELSPVETERLFARSRPDATSSQLKTLRDHLDQVRFVLRRFMQAQSLHEASPPVSGLWSLQTAVTFALISTQELQPSYLRGYGAIDEATALVVEQFVVELSTVLSRIGAYLADGTGGDLAARLAQLDSTQDEISLLRELERVISSQGLVELRGTLQDLVERASTPRFEIAVFGRVNAGKSSLLNWWLGNPLLPVGVIPVTAVPTRITHGKQAEARVWLGASRSTLITLDELPAYITEAGNPGNTKAVLEVAIRSPSDRLGNGVTLVDTPGLGSLAVAGAIQTLQYLPRCDLGLLLLEAGAPVTEVDLNVARALIDGGIDVLVAMSKADRLAANDLDDALIYTKKEFQSRLGIEVGISAISTVGADVSRTEVWFQEFLEPRLAQYRTEAAVSLRRKIGTLRESVLTALEARMRATASTQDPTRLSRFRESQSPFAEARSSIERTRREIGLIVQEVQAHLDVLLRAGAVELERSWREHDSLEDTFGRVQAKISRRALQIGDRIAKALDSLREQLAAAANADARARLDGRLPEPRGLPIGDFSWTDVAQRYRRPRGLLWSRPFLGILARKRLQRETKALLSGMPLT